MFVKMKKFRALEAEVAAMKSALNNGRVIVQAAQTNVAQPDGKGGLVNTLITEGPTSGQTKYKAGTFEIILNNPGGK